MVDQPLSSGHDIIVAGQDAPHRRDRSMDALQYVLAFLAIVAAALLGVTPLIPSSEPRPGVQARLYDADGRDREVKLEPEMASRVGDQAAAVDRRRRVASALTSMPSAARSASRPSRWSAWPTRPSEPT